jgi:electron transfer flavoprotein beta subunit
VVALDAPEIDDALYTALAKGAGRAIKITEVEPGVTACGAAWIFAQTLAAVPGLLPADLILTGVQSFDDLDGLVAPLLAYEFDLPHVGIVTRVTVNPSSNTVAVLKEFAGGVRGEFEVDLPAVLGIQAAEKPPRYVPVAKVRAAMKNQRIECVPVPVMADGGMPTVEVLGMAKPVIAGHAEMLEGSPEELANRVCDLLEARGLL